MSEVISEVFAAIADYAVGHGAAPIAGKVYHVTLDDQWEFWVNATKEPQNVDGANIQPFDCYVKFNGWPAGIVGPDGGCFAAGGAANESTFIDALRAATPSAQGGGA